MIPARKTLIRSACVITAAAASMVMLSAGIAQERDLKLAAAVGQPAPPPVLNPRHPETYVVQSGDTLWDIAAKFLRDPWYWPEIWQINPQVENPHLIFPGDTLTLVYNDDGRPAVTVTERGPASSAAAASTACRRAFASCRSRTRSRRFRTRRSRRSCRAPSCWTKRSSSICPTSSPIATALIASAGRDVYARGMRRPAGSVYNVVHLGNKLVDPDDNDDARLSGHLTSARDASSGPAIPRRCTCSTAHAKRSSATICSPSRT